MNIELDKLSLNISSVLSTVIDGEIPSHYQSEVSKVNLSEQEGCYIAAKLLIVARRESIIMFFAGHGRGVIFYKDDFDEPSLWYIPRYKIQDLAIKRIISAESKFHLLMLTELYNPAEEAVLYMTNGKQSKVIYMKDNDQLLSPKI